MFRIDFATLFVVVGLVELGFAVVMLHVSFAERTYAGYRDWALAAVFQALGLLAIPLRLYVPLELSAWISIVLLVAASDRIYRGLRRLAGDDGRRTADLVIVYAAGAVAFFVFLHGAPRTDLRILIAAAVTAYPMARAAVFCATRYPAELRRDGLFLAALLALVCLPTLGRGIVAWRWPAEPGVDLLQRGGAEPAMAAFSAAAMIALFIAFLVFHGKRFRLDLESALRRVRALEGIIPICMYCKKIRVDRESWQALESYLAEHSNAMLSHGVCPDCYDRAALDAERPAGPARG